jgi:membrane associated rhomboid family serine protease
MSYEEFQRDPRARQYVVDLKSRKPNQQRSITSHLIWLTVACFGLQVWKPAFTQWGLKLSDRILRGEQLYRLVTPVVLHGGIFHLMMNMVSLGRVGDDVEKLFGPGRYLSTYVAAGVVGNLVSAVQSPRPSLGASGAVFGIVGAYFTFLNRNEWLLGGYGQAMTASIGQTMLTNLLLGYFQPQIDQWAHIGGAVGGAAVAYFFGPRLYLVDLPNGYGRIVVDKPIVQVPRSIEVVPEAVGRTWQRLSGGVERQINRARFPGGNMPWQTAGDRRNYYMRQQAPSRSIKPVVVDDADF